MDIIKVGKQIAILRKDRGYTQEKLAEILSVSPQAVSKWENGHAMPEITLLPALAHALGTSIDNMLCVSRLQILSAVYGDGIIRRYNPTGKSVCGKGFIENQGEFLYSFFLSVGQQPS